MKPSKTLRVNRDMRIDSIAAALLLFFVGGCASIPVTQNTPRPFITLEKEPEGDHWRATWHFERPTRELRFERAGAGFRGRLFEVLTPGFAMARAGELEVLRTDGVPADTITVRFPAYSQTMVKEYAFFQTFSDGSVAIYTGHLVARPFDEGDGEECSDCFVRTFLFNGPPRTPLIVDGQVVASPFQWRDESTQGSYIYFGSLEPVESDDMISIIDPAVPEWLEEETKRALPALFAMYTERFGVALPERPMILLNYVDHGGSGYSNAGGTLPGQIHLTLDGAAWAKRSDEAFLLLMHFLAHEAVHLWNGQIVNYPGSQDAWMHEGGADALAQRTLLELGLIDESRFRDYQTTALNTCRKALDGFPLRDASKRRMYPLYYPCGNMLGLLTESMTNDKDLFSFWKSLIARALDSGEYDAEDYFAVLRSSGSSEKDMERFRSFTEQSAEPDHLLAMLVENGLVVTEEADPPRSYRQSVARDALVRILEEHCTGAYGFNMRNRGMALDTINNCGVIPAAATVTAIGGIDVLREGHRIWDVLRERCGSNVPISLQLKVEEGERSIDVPCSKRVKSLPKYVRIERRGLPDMGEVH